jgi:hypothetical protein
MMSPDELKKMGIEILQELPGNRIMRVRIGGLLTAILVAATFFAIAFLPAILFLTNMNRTIELSLRGVFFFGGAMLSISAIGCLPWLNYVYNPYHIEIGSDCMDIHLRGFMFLIPCIRKTEYLSDIICVSGIKRFQYVEFKCKGGRSFHQFGESAWFVMLGEKPGKLEAIADILNRWIEEEKAALNENIEANDES